MSIQVKWLEQCLTLEELRTFYLFSPYFLKNKMVRFAPSTESTDVGYRKIRVVYPVVFSSSSAC